MSHRSWLDRTLSRGNSLFSIDPADTVQLGFGEREYNAGLNIPPSISSDENWAGFDI